MISRRTGLPVHARKGVKGLAKEAVMIVRHLHPDLPSNNAALRFLLEMTRSERNTIYGMAKVNLALIERGDDPLRR